MKEIEHAKIPTIHVRPGDTIILKNYEDEVLRSKINESFDFDEAVIFEVEEGDFEKAKRGLGGAFLESEGG